MFRALQDHQPKELSLAGIADDLDAANRFIREVYPRGLSAGAQCAICGRAGRGGRGGRRTRNPLRRVPRFRAGASLWTGWTSDARPPGPQANRNESCRSMWYINQSTLRARCSLGILLASGPKARHFQGLSLSQCRDLSLGVEFGRASHPARPGCLDAPGFLESQLFRAGTAIFILQTFVYSGSSCGASPCRSARLKSHSSCSWPRSQLRSWPAAGVARSSSRRVWLLHACR